MTLWQDIRYALRGLRTNPGFAIIAALTMALGIGANTAIFSVVHAVLLRPLPYPEPDRILELERVYKDSIQGGQAGGMLAYMREHFRSASAIAAAGGGSSGMNLVTGEDAVYIRTLPVSANYFRVFGVAPTRGREFTEAEEAPNAPAAIVLSHALWQSRLGANPEIVGNTVSLGGRLYTVIGVMPENFRSLPTADAWTTIRTNRAATDLNYAIYCRLRSDVSPAQAQSELDAMAPGLREAHPRFLNKEDSLRLLPFQSALTQGTREALLVLLAASAVVLLIAAANTASLLLARSARRRREIATRTALGAARSRILRQLLTESVVLSLFGAAFGLLLAEWGVTGLVKLVPRNYLNSQTIQIDAPVLWVTLAAAVVTGVLFGLAPAWQAARIDIVDALKQNVGLMNSGRRGWLGRALVITEIALGMVLLVSAGLLIRTFENLRAVNPGFDPHGIVTAQMSLQGPSYQSAAKIVPLFEQALARVRETPGVEFAAVGNNAPIASYLNLAANVPDSKDTDIQAFDWRYITADYFQVLRIPLVEGRMVADTDNEHSAPVALVNQALERRYFRGETAIGRHVHVLATDVDPPREIVGVVRDIHDHSLLRSAVPTIYVPLRQVPDAHFRISHTFFPVQWMVRTRGDSAQVSRSLRDAVRAIDPKLPLSGFRTMDDILGNSLSEQRFHMLLLGLFAGLALALSAAGVYGLMSYSVAQQTKEIGIRMALGATARDTLREIVQRGLRLAVAGIVLGCVGSLAATRLLTKFIFGVTPNDALTYAAVIAVLLSVATAASFVPARRAVRGNPMNSLRAE